jgi:hypothetical protein
MRFTCGSVEKSGNQDTITTMNERTKKILMILLLAAGSAFFLYNGFALLFSES